jgi:hypothetical protein
MSEKDDICKSDPKKPNDIAGTKPTLDPEQAKKNREAHINSFIEYSEPTLATEDEVYTPSKDAEAQDGDKREYSVEDECEDGEDYPITEAKKQKEPHADTEKTPKSPLQ